MKARRVVDIRNKAAPDARNHRVTPQAVAVDVRKVLESAIANAKVKAEKAGTVLMKPNCLSPRLMRWQQ